MENLIEKIKANSDDQDLNMEKVEAHIEEYRETIEVYIKEKNIKDAKLLIEEIRALDFDIRSVVTNNAMDVNYLKYLNGNFSTYHWKDQNKARQLINQGLQFATAGNTLAIRPLIIQLIALMPDDEKPKETLG